MNKLSTIQAANLPEWARSDIASELLAAIIANAPEQAFLGAKRRFCGRLENPDGVQPSYVGKPAARLRRIRKEWIERRYTALDRQFAVIGFWDAAEAERILTAEDANALIERVLREAAQKAAA